MFLMQEFFIVLTSNMLFSYMLGTDILFSADKSKRSMNVLGLYVLVFSVVCSIPTSFTDSVVPESLVPLADTAVVIVLYMAGLGISRISGQKSFYNYKKYMHYAAFNTVVMGILYIGRKSDGLEEHVLFALESAIGFFIAAWLMGLAVKFLSGKDIPASFRGYPAMMIFIGVISMALCSMSA